MLSRQILRAIILVLVAVFCVGVFVMRPISVLQMQQLLLSQRAEDVEVCKRGPELPYANSITLERFLSPVDNQTTFFVSNINRAWVVEWEPPVLDSATNAVLRAISNNQSSCHFVDVGMNDGFFTVFGAAHGCQVISFDLQNTCVDLARAALRLNHLEHLVTLNAIPVSDNDTEITVPHDPHAPCSPVRGVLPGALKSPKCNSNADCPQNTMNTTATFRPAVLSQVIPENVTIDFLKIDVEGFELPVLRGAERLFQERRVVFATVEIWPPRWDRLFTRADLNFFERLLSYGYQIRCSSHAKRKARCEAQQPTSNAMEFYKLLEQRACVDYFFERAGPEFPTKVDCI